MIANAHEQSTDFIAYSLHSDVNYKIKEII